jgi:hypothetical protein
VPGPTAATIAVNTPMEVSRVGVLGFYQRPLSGPASLKQAPCREPRSLSRFQQTATSYAFRDEQDELLRAVVND